VILAVTGDPLFAHGLNLAVWIILIVKVVVIFALVLLSVLFMVMYERKAVAWLGVRHGPNRAGPGGWLQSLADGTKLFFKEAFLPARADKWVYKAAPYLVVVPAFVAFSIVPLGGHITIAGHTTLLQLANPQWGILLLLVTSGIGVYGVMLAGWASGSKYPLLGSVRASAQMVSYEAVLGLTVAAVVLETGSLHTSTIWLAQHGSFLIHWNIIRTGVIPFVLFSIAITAEMTRAPFDLVEAEEELAGGFNLEYSSIGFAFFYLAEYMNLVTNAAIIVTLWLGGPDGPRIAGNAIGPFWFAVKELIVLYIFVWIRATLPRVRYDQLQELAWKRLIPLALAMLMIDAGFQVSRVWGLVALGGSLVGLAVLVRAIDVGRDASRIEARLEEAQGA
jgi:NADH-quinone oxidoreductase subunit H